MGRSVSNLSNADFCVYFESDEENEYFYDDMVENIQETVIENYPSFMSVSDWEGENHIILQNELCEVAISEYCGLMCISGRARSGLGARFVRYVEHFLEERYGEFRRVGQFSNGNSIYERKEVN